MKYIPILLLAFALILPQIAQAKSSYLVAPGRVTLDLARPQTESFIITNNGDEKIRLSINPTYFKIDDKALNIGTHLKPETAEIENLTPYIRVSPRTLSLAPGQKRSIRISVRPDKELADGEYRTHLLVSMLEAANTLNTNTTDADAVGMKLNIKMETGVAIFGHKGNPEPILDVSCSTDEENKTLVFVINNTTVWRFDGGIELYPGSGATETPLAKDHVVSYRESRSDIITNWVPTSKGPFFVRWVDLETKEIAGSTTCRLE